MKLAKENLGKVSVTVEKAYHSINKEYDKLVVVEEEGQFRTFISRKPVPIGTELTDREFWLPFSSVKESIVIDYNKFKQYIRTGEGLLDNSIVTRHIKDRNVTGDKIAEATITFVNIANEAVTLPKINKEAIDTTLTKEGHLAEAKHTGDRLLNVEGLSVVKVPSTKSTVLDAWQIIDKKGNVHGVTINTYKDKSIDAIWLSVHENDLQPENPEVKVDNPRYLNIIYNKADGTQQKVSIPLASFVTEAEFSKNGFKVIDGVVNLKISSDITTSRYFHFDADGNITLDGFEERILEDLGTLEHSQPGDGTMWGEFKKQEEIREQVSNSTHQVFSDNWDEQDDDPEDYDPLAVTEASYAYNWKSVTNPNKTGNIEDLVNKVDALAVGIFYGYHPNENELPQDITEKGYAYVGTDNPYKIYNFNGTQWKDSGTTIQATSEADEEDITYNENDKLTFKDRNNTDGMGYVILRKNKSFAEQVTKANTIYEIRYEFDLSGAEVVIPEGCVLDFQGGSLNNGTINGNLTIIQGNTFGIFDSIVILGEWNVRTISSNMFKILKEENSIKNVFNLSNSNVTNKIIIENNGYDYLVTNGNPVNLTSNSDIEINGNIKIVPNSASSYVFFDGQDVSNINIYGCGKFIGDRDEHSYIGETTHEWGYGFQFRGNVDNIRIYGLFFTNFTGGSIRFNDKTSNIKIENVTTERNRTGGIEFTGGAENIIISNCNFKDVGIDTEHSTYTNPGDAIGIEPNYHIGLDNINIENCKFVNCRLPIYITNNYEMGGSFSVRGCIIEGGLFGSAGILFGNMKFINIENCRISDRDGSVLVCNNDYKNLSIKNNYITSKGGIIYYEKVPTGFSNIENNKFEDEGAFSIKGLKNCNFINNSLKTNGAFVQDSQSSVINFINNKIDGLFCYGGYKMVLNDSIITENTFIQPTSQNAIWFSGENIKIKNNNFITNKELEDSRACLFLTDASNIVISENLFATKINSMNYYIMSSNSSNIYLLNNIFSEKEINDRYIQGDGIVFIKDGEYRTRGSSDERPIIPTYKYLIGKLYFDTTLNKPIWWTGSKWVDATGTDV